MFSNFFFENHDVYEIMCKNSVQQRRPQMTIWRMRIACCITKATNTFADYVILTALPFQQWLHERARLVCYAYFAFLVVIFMKYIYQFHIQAVSDL